MLPITHRMDQEFIRVLNGSGPEVQGKHLFKQAVLLAVSYNIDGSCSAARQTPLAEA